jgi:APA family basic amino acid/polyamine antiporter
MNDGGAGDGGRRLGLFDVAGVAVGAMIGVGIFFTPARVAARAGGEGPALGVWAVGGLIALLGALAFAELGGRLPKAGGQFRVLQEAFGRRVAFVYMIVVGVVESSAAVAILALICARHLAMVGGFPVDGPLAGGLSAALVAVAFGLAASGVRQGATAVNVGVAVKLAVAAGVVLLGVFGAPERTVAAAAPTPAPVVGYGGWFAALLPAFFSYGGWQQTLWVGGAVRDPGRNLPRGIVLGTLVVVATYLGLNAAYFRLLGAEGVAGSTAVAADAVSAAWPAAGRAVALAIAWSAFGCMQTILFTGPFQLVALAEDGLAPRGLAVVTARGAPARAAACFAAVALTLAFAAGFQGVDALLDAVVCVDWVFFTLTGIALFVLRKRADLPLPFRVPGYPFVPGAFVLCAAAVALSPFFDAKARTGGLFAAGAVVLVALFSLRFVRKDSPKATLGR